MIDITGLDKAEVLAALYNNSKPLGMGHLHYDPRPMTVEQARRIIEERGDDLHAQLGGGVRRGYGPGSYQFDYLKGRVLKVDLSGDQFSEAGYDRDIGAGAAARVVDSIRVRNRGVTP